MTPCDLLLKAAEELEEAKWGQGNYDTGDRVCMIGALRRAANRYGHFREYENYTSAYLRIARSLGIAGRQSPEIWNDRIATTKEQVVRALRDAAGPKGN